MEKKEENTAERDIRPRPEREIDRKRESRVRERAQLSPLVCVSSHNIILIVVAVVASISLSACGMSPSVYHTGHVVCGMCYNDSAFSW